MKKSKANGNQKADEVVMEICRGIERIFNPLWMLNNCGGSTTPDHFDLERCMEEKLTRAIDPDYGELKEQLGKGEGSEDEMMRLRVIELETWFLVGCLFGMKLSGRPMEEIRQTAVSMVRRQRTV